MSTLPESVTSCRSRTMYEMKGPNPMGGTRKYDNHPTGLQIRQMPEHLLSYTAISLQKPVFFSGNLTHLRAAYLPPIYSATPLQVQTKLCGRVTDLPPVYRAPLHSQV